MQRRYTWIWTLALAIGCTGISYGQSGIAKETKILEQQLNLLSAGGKKQGGGETFEFNGCSCKYTKTASKTGDGFNMSRTSEFDLKEVTSVSYARNDNNTYELSVKLKTEDNALTQVLDLSSIHVNLYTSDENQVKSMADRFKQAVKACGSK
jgi:hypothetical protein